jgi:hypothetical protein
MMFFTFRSLFNIFSLGCRLCSCIKPHNPRLDPLFTQEYERRFNIWLDNLEYAVSYNARHTSHWVCYLYPCPDRACKLSNFSPRKKSNVRPLLPSLRWE